MHPHSITHIITFRIFDFIPLGVDYLNSVNTVGNNGFEFSFDLKALEEVVVWPGLFPYSAELTHQMSASSPAKTFR